MPNSVEIHKNLIDIERVIVSKNPTLLKIIPGFVIRYLKRITHQDAINGYIYRNREKVGLEFVDAILKEFGADITSRYAITPKSPKGDLIRFASIPKSPEGDLLRSAGTPKSPEGDLLRFAGTPKSPEGDLLRSAGTPKSPEGDLLRSAGTPKSPKGDLLRSAGTPKSPEGDLLPPLEGEGRGGVIPDPGSRIPDLYSGRYIIASNHPLGGLDGMALMQAVGRMRRDLVFPVNDILMNVPGLQPLFIPINKHGKNTDNVRIIDETFSSEKVILYFPAGLVSRKQKGGVIRDLEWKKTFISKARRYHRDVVPVHISGQNSNFFYNLSNWRKRLGIKANLEMLYLVDEMVKQKDKPIRITFGDPIPWTTFNKSRTDSQWAEWVKEIVYSLRDNP